MLNELKISAILLLFINVMLASDNEMTNSFASISECDDSAESIYYNTLDDTNDQAMATEAYLAAHMLCTYYAGGPSEYEVRID
ncbi:MAG: hypothetical protein CMP12_22425 [Zunongwangia sp.]|uniref:hypothetical protein n=1 Tax=Zunongwangia profunda TaxID=398743 RepID=UPI000C949A2D|nr:hypothetical protein [Zunongwangia profunda]MAC66148.1 hypothetical protein [Flavobacteriaceae bacterium]MAO38621.1 hypothetical protein [Zunongwangia sp.]|tara:strand:+ start:115 stop:363 length:249 start_codon:yes stop_codon:yes gene_type:complete